MGTKTKAKLVAAKRAPKKKSAPITIADHSSRSMAAIISRLQQESNDPSILGGGDAGRIIVGIRIPLALEYLWQNEVLPLGRVILLVGKTHCNKSSLVYDFMRMLAPYHGQGFVIENETKASPDMGQSIIGYEDEAAIKPTPWAVIPSYSLNDWQSKLQLLCAELRNIWCKKTEENPKPPGPIWPVFIGLDSVMGKLTEESQDKIESEGYAGRNFALEALSITQFLKKFPSDIASWPINLFLVNHLKPRKAEHGHAIERGKAGGAQIDFQASFELELSRVKKIDQIDPDPSGFRLGGNVIKMHCYKNGLGEDRREIFVPIIWYSRPSANGPRQHTRWDWNSALITLLTEGFDEKTYQNRINEICHVRRGEKGSLFYCNEVGVPRSEAMPRSDLGQVISDHKEVREGLRNLFGIKRRKEFVSGQNYLKQLQLTREQAEQAIAKVERDAREVGVNDA